MLRSLGESRSDLSLTQRGDGSGGGPACSRSPLQHARADSRGLADRRCGADTHVWTHRDTGRVLMLPRDEKQRRQINNGGWEGGRGTGRLTATLLAGQLADVCVEGWGWKRFGWTSQRASCGSSQTLSYVDSNSQCEQVRGQQGRAKDEENVRGEDPPLHHVRLPDAE